MLCRHRTHSARQGLSVGKVWGLQVLQARRRCWGLRSEQAALLTPFWLWGSGGLAPNPTRSRCSAVDSVFSASCSNLYADTEAPESSDSLCRSTCSLFVDAAVPAGWGRALLTPSCAALRDPGQRFRAEQNCNRLFCFSQTWAAKKPPTHPQLPRRHPAGGREPWVVTPCFPDVHYRSYLSMCNTVNLFNFLIIYLFLLSLHTDSTNVLF